jgi:hypothetical protein
VAQRQGSQRAFDWPHWPDLAPVRVVELRQLAGLAAVVANCYWVENLVAGQADQAAR